MPDQATAVAAIGAALVKVQAYGGVTPPPTGDLTWFTSKAGRSITNIGTATLQAVNPCPSNQCAYSGSTKFKAILAASGMVLLPWRGPAGTLAGTGGGHDDYYGNENWARDLSVDAFTLLSQPHPNRYRVVGATGPLAWQAYHGNTDDGELWADGDFASYATMSAKPTLQDQPIACHSYGNTLALPPGLASGPEGAIVQPCRTSCTPLGQRNGKRAHIFDLATSEWSRFSANLMPDNPGYSHSFIDYARKRVVMHSTAALVVLALDVDPAKRLFTKLVDLPSNLNYMVWDHLVGPDLYVGLCPTVGGAPRLWVVDPAGNAFTQPGCAQAWPTPALPSGGGCWSKQIGGFAYYHGAGESTVVAVTPPSGNPRTAPWNVQLLTFSGDAPPSDDVVGAGAHCKRFVEHEAATGFLWLGRTTAPVQFFKL